MLVISTLLIGCVEPPYRYEVHDTGEGSVQLERVPKTAAQPVVPAAATPPPPAPAMVQNPSDQEKIQELEQQVKALSQENQKLKQAAPTTLPAPQ